MEPVRFVMNGVYAMENVYVGQAWIRLSDMIITEQICEKGHEESSSIIA